MAVIGYNLDFVADLSNPFPRKAIPYESGKGAFNQGTSLCLPAFPDQRISDTVPDYSLWRRTQVLIQAKKV